MCWQDIGPGAGVSRKWFARVRDFKEPREKSVEHNDDDDDEMTMMMMMMMIWGIHLDFKEPSYDTVSMAESGTLRTLREKSVETTMVKNGDGNEDDDSD